MRTRLHILLVLFGLLLSVVSVAGEPVTIGVMEIAGKGGVPQDKADILLDMLAGEIAEIGDVRVITKVDILEMLEIEKRRRLAGCTNKECASEIAGALGTRWIIVGNVGLIGDVYLINLKLIDTQNSLVVGRVSRKVRGGERELLDELPDAARELFDRVGAQLGLHIRDRVTVAARHAQPIAESPSRVIVITRKDIEESGATNLMELLRRYPALNVLMINPSHNMVFIRGSYRVLLLLDGRELNMELFPPPFYDTLPVGIQDMDRIEIVLGPNSALYGANAVSAVINIVTRKPGTDFHADLSLATGHNGKTIVGGMLEGGTGPWAFQGTFGVDRENSWMDRSRVLLDLLRATATARMTYDEGSLNINGGLLSGDMLLFSDGMGYMPVNDILFSHAKVDFEYRDFKARAYWYRLKGAADIELNLYHPEMGIDLGSFSTMHFRSNVFHADAQYNLELFENNLLLAGTDFRYTHYHADQIVNPDLWEIRAGAFLHDEHRLADVLLLTGGIRFDWNSRTDAALSPQLALVFNPAGGHYIRLSGGVAFRKPVLMESSANFKINAAPGFESDMEKLFEEIGISNPDLKNEILTTVEIGYKGFCLEKKLRLGANVYYAKNEKAIELDTRFVFNEYIQLDFEETEFGYVNRPSVEHIFGASASIEGDLLDELTLFLRGEYRKIWLEFKNDDEWHVHTEHLRLAAGGVLRLPLGITASLTAVYAGPLQDTLLDPRSVLAPSLWSDVPERVYLMAFISWRLDLGTTRVDLGLSFFNPFGPRFREKLGTVAPDGTNFGGEILGPRAMVTARIIY
jgi:outer membrane receptor protein involved in Fe transport